MQDRRSTPAQPRVADISIDLTDCVVEHEPQKSREPLAPVAPEACVSTPAPKSTAKSDAEKFAELERAREKLKNSGHENLYISAVSPDDMMKLLLDDEFEHKIHESFELQGKKLALIEKRPKQ